MPESLAEQRIAITRELNQRATDHLTQVGRALMPIEGPELQRLFDVFGVEVSPSALAMTKDVHISPSLLASSQKPEQLGAILTDWGKTITAAEYYKNNGRLPRIG